MFNILLLCNVITLQFQKISLLLPQNGLEFPGGGGVSLRGKHLKKYMKIKMEFPEGWRILGKILSVGEECIFSGTTHFLCLTTCFLILFFSIFFLFLYYYSLTAVLPTKMTGNLFTRFSPVFQFTFLY